MKKLTLNRTESLTGGLNCALHGASLVLLLHPFFMINSDWIFDPVAECWYNVH